MKTNVTPIFTNELRMSFLQTNYSNPYIYNIKTIFFNMLTNSFVKFNPTHVSALKNGRIHVYMGGYIRISFYLTLKFIHNKAKICYCPKLKNRVHCVAVNRRIDSTEQKLRAWMLIRCYCRRLCPQRRYSRRHGGKCESENSLRCRFFGGQKWAKLQNCMENYLAKRKHCDKRR